jgi:hypothetical protein
MKICQQHGKEQFHEWLHIIVQSLTLALFCASREIGLDHSFRRLLGFLDLPPEAAPQIPRNDRFVQPQLPRREVLPVRPGTLPWPPFRSILRSVCFCPLALK